MVSRFAMVIGGRVQGVGFRYFTQQCARRLGIQGWVRNRADGCVELAASGPADLLEEFAAEIEYGPRLSAVDRVDRRELEVGEALPSGFEIRR